ncbi:MAG: bifunctional folylpolyglutamate synthase/dihydrofolate synthase [Lachnospiraceae bacterium]|nr:bifunctional folylpolyglutamate synthase/dihydrofolate synthase [Lachnospiraceae bacterium]
MTIEETMAYIQAVTKKGSVLGLENMAELTKRVGHPEADLHFVHIAGTNGKGSVVAMLSSILEEAGFRVGRYISPTINYYNERIHVSGMDIPDEALARHMTTLKKAAEDMVEEGLEHPTAFELETVLGFLYFKECACDVVLLECGMGGLLDATNIIPKKDLAILTSISLDHVGILGNTLEEIARNKAGIITPGCEVVLYAPDCVELLNTPEDSKEGAAVVEVVRNACKEAGAFLTITEPEKLQVISDSLQGQRFSYKDWEEVAIPLIGEHQLRNAMVVLEAVEVLLRKGYEIPKEAVYRGLSHTYWPGRLELVSSRPVILLDGAHNPDGAYKLSRCMKKYLSRYLTIVIMGVLRDKDYPKMIEQIEPLANVIITIDPDNARALSDEELERAILAYQKEHGARAQVLHGGRIESGVELANQLILQLGTQDVALVVMGSLSFQGDFRRYLGI